MVKKRAQSSENGVSETIGFVIILGLVVTGISLVTLYGYPILLDEQANANVRNMERSMIVIQNDLKSLAFKNVPFKETSIQISGGTLFVINPDIGQPPPSFNIYYYPKGETPANNKITDIPRPFYPGRLEYRSDKGDAFVILENGAVIIRYWSDSTGSAMLAEPRWFYDRATSTLFIPLIKLSSEGYLSGNGIGNVQLQMTGPPKSYRYNLDNGTVLISYTPDNENHHATAWKNYFNNSLFLTPSESSPGNYTISNVNTTIIKTYDISVVNI